MINEGVEGFRRFPPTVSMLLELITKKNCGKKTRILFNAIRVVVMTRSLELIYFDLFGPVTLASLGSKTYCFVFTCDY